MISDTTESRVVQFIRENRGCNTSEIRPIVTGAVLDEMMEAGVILRARVHGRYQRRNEIRHFLPGDDLASYETPGVRLFPMKSRVRSVAATSPVSPRYGVQSVSLPSVVGCAALARLGYESIQGPYNAIYAVVSHCPCITLPELWAQDVIRVHAGSGQNLHAWLCFMVAQARVLNVGQASETDWWIYVCDYPGDVRTRCSPISHPLGVRQVTPGVYRHLRDLVPDRHSGWCAA